jgi:hypothetical protein
MGNAGGSDVCDRLRRSASSRWSRSRLAVMITVCTLTGPAAMIAGAEPSWAGTTFGSVPGYTLLGVACSSASTCVAVGGNNSGQQVVVPITNGVPGSVEPVPGASKLAGVACSSATACVAVGNTNSPNSGLILPIVNGAPGTPQPVPGTTLDLFGVACSGATSCIAVGRNPSDQGVVVPITNGTPGATQIVPGTWGNAGGLSGVACPSATTCVAVGGDSSSGPGVVVPITNGTPGSLQTVSGTFTLTGVACISTTTCEGAGTSPPPNSSSARGMVVPITNGIPGAAQAVPGTVQFNGIACANATMCNAVGFSLSSSGAQGVVVPVTNGIPGSAQASGTSELLSIACPSDTTCEAVGIGVVTTFSVVRTVVSLTFDNGAISQYTLGYQKALQARGVRATFYVSSGIMGGTTHLSWTQLSTLAAAGNEIGGKTVHGTTLTTLSTDQQVSEICTDRQNLLAHGLKPAGFAYPGGAFNATIQAEVRECGYGTARTAGSLSVAGPTYAETLPPKNFLALRAYAPSGRITLANLQALVTGAASAGGWVPIVIQKVCSQALDPANYGTCTAAAGWMELADLDTFLTWVLAAGQPNGAPDGTVFKATGATARSVDTIAPATSIACNGAACTSSAYAGPVSVSLSASDFGSGVASIHYTIDGSTPTQASPTYTDAFPLSASATVQYRSWDNAGNVETTRSQTIHLI